MIVYLHGFNSAGNNKNGKVVELKKLDDVLPLTYDTFAKFEDILEYLIDAVKDIEHPVFVGSSMGGFYAAILAQHFGTPSVLINPLYDPIGFLDSQTESAHTNLTDFSVHSVYAETIESYRHLKVDISNPAKYEIIPLVIVADDDEVISAAGMKEYFKDMILFSTADGGHRYDKPKQIISVIQNYLNQASVATDLNT